MKHPPTVPNLNLTLKKGFVEQGFVLVGALIFSAIILASSIFVLKDAYAMSASVNCPNITFSWSYNPDQNSLWIDWNQDGSVDETYNNAVQAGATQITTRAPSGVTRASATLIGSGFVSLDSSSVGFSCGAPPPPSPSPSPPPITVGPISVGYSNCAGGNRNANLSWSPNPNQNALWVWWDNGVQFTQNLSGSTSSAQITVPAGRNITYQVGYFDFVNFTEFNRRQETSPACATITPAILAGIVQADCTAAGNRPVRFGWNRATGATIEQEYLDISFVNGNFAPGEFAGHNVINSGGQFQIEIPGGSTFYWRVNTYLAGNWYPSEVRTNSTDPCLTSPPPPTTYGVTGQPQCANNTYDATLTWNASPTATGYILRIDNGRGGVVEYNVGNITAQPVTGLEAEVTYYWAVRAYNGAGEGQGGPVQILYVSACVTQPSPIPTPAQSPSPTPTAQPRAVGLSADFVCANGQPDILFNWGLSNGDPNTISGYWLDISEQQLTAGSPPSTYIHVFVNKNNPSFNWKESNPIFQDGITFVPLAGRTYYWRVWTFAGDVTNGIHSYSSGPIANNCAGTTPSAPPSPQPTPQPSIIRPRALTVSPESCDGNTWTLSFEWNPGSRDGQSPQTQWLDLQFVSETSWDPGHYVNNGPIPGTTRQWLWSGIAPDAAHRWRVANFFDGDGNPYHSQDLTFNTADFGQCGARPSPQPTPSPSPTPPLNISLPTNPGIINATCVNDKWNIELTWQPGNRGSEAPQSQWLDLQHASEPNWNNFVNAGPLSGSTTDYIWSGIDPGTPHRIRVANFFSGDSNPYHSTNTEFNTADFGQCGAQPTPLPTPTPPLVCNNPAPFDLTGPTGIITIPTPGFSWTASSGHTQYFIDLSDDNFQTWWYVAVSPDQTVFPWPIWAEDFAGGKPAPNTGLEEDVTYQWRMTAMRQCSDGTQKFTPSNQTFNLEYDPDNQPPVLVYPARDLEVLPQNQDGTVGYDNGQSGVNATFSWLRDTRNDAVFGLTQFLYLKFDDGTLPNRTNSLSIALDGTVSAFELTAPGMLPNTAHLAAVDTCRDNACSTGSTLSSPVSFRTASISGPQPTPSPTPSPGPQAPQKPLLISPPNNQEFDIETTTNITFSWEDPSRLATNFWLDISHDPGFNSWWGCNPTGTSIGWINCDWLEFQASPGGAQLVGDPDVPLSSLQDGTYSWRVVGVNDVSFSPQSDPKTFRITHGSQTVRPQPARGLGSTSVCTDDNRPQIAFIWNDAPDADGWFIDVSQDGFQTYSNAPVGKPVAGLSPAFTWDNQHPLSDRGSGITTPQSGQTYQWRVWAYRGGITNGTHSEFPNPTITARNCTPKEPARLNPVVVSNQTCTADGKVNVPFTWALATGGTIDSQWIDVDQDGDFAGQYFASSNPPNVNDTSYTSGTGQNIPSLNAGTTYFWRIATHFAGDSAETWYPSIRGFFETRNDCSPQVTRPAAPQNLTSASTCVENQAQIGFAWSQVPDVDGYFVDISQTGSFEPGQFSNAFIPPTSAPGFTWDNTHPVSGPFTSPDPNRTYTWRVYAYKDSIENGTHSAQPYPRFTVRDCTPKVRAVLKQVNKTDMTCTDGLARVNFSWTKGTGGTIDSQWIDVSLDPGFSPGYHASSNPPFTNDQSFTTGQAGIPNLELNNIYYWRISTHFAQDDPSVWYPSLTGSFDTTDVCGPSPQPIPILNPPALPACSDEPYAATFSWDQKGGGWFVDISTDSNFGQWWYKPLSQQYSTTAPDGFVSGSLPPLQLRPDTTYYWRLYYGVQNQWLYGEPFNVPKCSLPPNLKVTNFTLNKTAFNAGEIVEAAVDVLNESDRISENFTISVSTDSANPMSCGDTGIVESGTGIALANSTRYVLLRFTIPEDTSPGPKIARVFADNKCQITERVESDNQLTVNYTLSGPAPLVLNPPVLPSCSDGTYVTTLSWESLSGSNWWVDVSTDSNFNNFWHAFTRYQYSVEVTPSNFTSDNLGRLSLQPDTTYYWRVFRGAPPHVYGEPFNVPKCSLPQGPELQIVSFQLTNQQVTPNTPLEARITLRNNGFGPASNYWLQVSANQPSPLTCRPRGGTGGPTLNPGQETQLTIRSSSTNPFQAPGQNGNYVARVFVDSSCEFTETNEDNNQATVNYTVSEPQVQFSSPSEFSVASQDCNGINGSARIRFGWTQSQGAEGYYLDVSRDNFATWDHARILGQSTTSFTWEATNPMFFRTKPESNTTYQYRIIAFQGNTLSYPHTFGTPDGSFLSPNCTPVGPTDPPAPAQNLVANDPSCKKTPPPESKTVADITLRWDLATGAQEYRVELSRTTNASIRWTANDPGKAAQFGITDGLYTWKDLPPIDHWWRVISINGVGETASQEAIAPLGDCTRITEGSLSITQAVGYYINVRDTSVNFNEDAVVASIRQYWAATPSYGQFNETTVRSLLQTLRTQSVAGGVNPAFMATLWREESGGTINTPGILPFGCGGYNEFSASLSCAISTVRGWAPGPDGFAKGMHDYWCGPNNPSPVCAPLNQLGNFYAKIQNFYNQFAIGASAQSITPTPTQTSAPTQSAPTQTPTPSRSNVTVVPIYLVPSGVTAQSSGGLSSGVAAAQQFYAAQTSVSFRTGALQVRNSSHDAKWFCGGAEKTNCSTASLFNQVLAEVGEGPAGIKYLVFLSGVQDLTKGVPGHEHARAYIGGNLAVFGDLAFQALNGGNCGIYSDHCGNDSAIVAHELGHNFGIDGDYGECGTCLMAIPVIHPLSQLSLSDSEKTTVKNHLTGTSGMLPSKNRQLASEGQQIPVLGTKDTNKAEEKIPAVFDLTKFSRSIVEFII